MKKTYTHIVRSKITGQAYSRHSTKDLALAAFGKKTTDRDPLEIIEYSNEYWSKMGLRKIKR